MSRKVLVVDDSAPLRNALQDVLVTEGFSVTTASNGSEGLELVHNDHFDLMLLDIDMPIVSGLKVLRMLRFDPTYTNLPIIMLTARDKPRDQYWGKLTGANAYLTKPFERDMLIATVHDVLENSQRKRTMLDASEKLEKETTEELDFKAEEVHEKQLFKMTLINKIYEISIKEKTLRETCFQIDQIYASVMDYDLAIFFITDEDIFKMYIYVHAPVSREFFQATKNRLMEEYETRSGKRIVKENAEVILEDPQHNMIKGAGGAEILGFRSDLLHSKGDTYGILALSRARNGEFDREDNEMLCMIAGQSNIIIDNARMYEKLQGLAVADGLTGLYNHRYFQEQLEKEFSRSRRFNLSLSLIILDIDHFKNINDVHGHQQGDVILKGISTILRNCIREIDLAARYGGEEFVVILPETPKRSATVVAERINTAVRERVYQSEKGPIRVTASIGLAGQPDDDISTRLDLISKSDLALYHAKRTGRNRICLYSPELEDEFK